MVHHRERLPLRLEAGDHLGGIHARLDDLDGHFSADGPLLLGDKHQSKPADADLLHQFVRPDNRADRSRTVSAKFVAQDCLRHFVGEAMHLAGDIVGLLHALDEDCAVVVGQDWGSPVATTLALFRPDLVRGLVMLSTPYFPRGDTDFLSELTSKLGPDNYQVFFQEPGVAETAFEADVRATVVGALLGISGEAVEMHNTTEVDGTKAMPDHSDKVLPKWLSEADVDYYTAEFSRTGYRGALNWYRNHRQNWEYMSAWHQAPIKVPAMFVGGDRDPVLHWPGTLALVKQIGHLSYPHSACLCHPGRLRPLDPPGTTGRDQRSLARVLGRHLKGTADRRLPTVTRVADVGADHSPAPALLDGESRVGKTHEPSPRSVLGGPKCRYRPVARRRVHIRPGLGR